MIAEFRWRRPDSGSSHLFQLAHASLGLCCAKHPPSTTALTHRQNNARLLAHRFCVQDLFYILPSPRVPRSRESSVSRDSRSKAVYSTGLALRSDVMGLECSLYLVYGIKEWASRWCGARLDPSVQTRRRCIGLNDSRQQAPQQAGFDPWRRTVTRGLRACSILSLVVLSCTSCLPSIKRRTAICTSLPGNAAWANSRSWIMRSVIAILFSCESNFVANLALPFVLSGLDARSKDIARPRVAIFLLFKTFCKASLSALRLIISFFILFTYCRHV